MKHTEFRKAAENLQMWANVIPGVVEDCVKQSLEALEEGKCITGASPNQMAELILRKVSERIEDVMTCFDDTMNSINMSRRYWMFFDSLDLTDEGWKELRRVFEEHRNPSV